MTKEKQQTKITIDKRRKDNKGNWKKRYGPEYALVFTLKANREAFEVLCLK